MLTNQIARNCLVLLLLAIAAGLSLSPGDNAVAQEERPLHERRLARQGENMTLALVVDINARNHFWNT